MPLHCAFSKNDFLRRLSSAHLSPLPMGILPPFLTCVFLAKPAFRQFPSKIFFFLCGASPWSPLNGEDRFPSTLPGGLCFSWFGFGSSKKMAVEASEEFGVHSALRTLSQESLLNSICGSFSPTPPPPLAMKLFFFLLCLPGGDFFSIEAPPSFGPLPNRDRSFFFFPPGSSFPFFCFPHDPSPPLGALVLGGKFFRSVSPLCRLPFFPRSITLSPPGI